MGDGIHLNLSINETNAILFALAKQPYDTVAQLIDKIRDQALPQVPEDQRNDERRQSMADKLTEMVQAEDVGHVPMPGK
jgi:hypothetical protein